MIHGVGSRRQVWEPVLQRLSSERDVISLDLPGHGGSPMPRGAPPFTPPNLARMVAEFLEGLGIGRAHLAGNSLGGWISFELAKMGRARSVTGLSPAGLWRGSPPPYIGAAFFASYAAAEILGPLAPVFASDGLLRSFIIGQFFGRPWKLPASEAVATLDGFLHAPGVWRVLEDAAGGRFKGGREINVPVTVAWGAREAILLPCESQNRGELPAHTRWLNLPGCGHVPTYDDPELVAKTILDGSSARSV